MVDQMVAMEHMLPHVQVEGVFICEDLSTSWSAPYGGRAKEDARNAKFLETTMVGLIHKSLDWFMCGFTPGEILWLGEKVSAEHWVQQTIMVESSTQSSKAHTLLQKFGCL